MRYTAGQFIVLDENTMPLIRIGVSGNARQRRKIYKRLKNKFSGVMRMDEYIATFHCTARR